MNFYLSSKRLIAMIHHRHLLMLEINRLIKAAKETKKIKLTLKALKTTEALFLHDYLREMGSISKIGCFLRKIPTITEVSVHL